MRASVADLGTLRRWWWLIVASTLIAGVTVALVSLALPKQYESTTVVLVNPKQVLLPGADTGYSTQLDQLVQTYVQLISNKPVWDRLVADGVPRTRDQLKKGLTIKREPNTSLIDVTIRDSDPEVALRVAQDIIPAFNRSLDELQSRVQGAKPAAAQLDSLVPWSVPSDAPIDSVSPKVPLNVVVALTAGLLISIGIAFLLEYLDDTVKNEYDVRLRLDLPLLGSILFKKGMAQRQKSRDFVALVTLIDPKEPMAEAFKAIRTGLIFSVTEKQALSTIVVTSTTPGEGKTSTACNLAIVMAQAGRRVILVDADFRRPNLHEVFQRGSNVGLGNLILEDRPEEELISDTELPNLKLLCSGPTPPNPSEILGSPGFQRVVDRLKGRCDIVIFDTPPVGAVTDATVLAARADGVVVVVDGGRTPTSAVLRTRDTLRSVNAKILGVVLNKMKVAKRGDSYSYYGPSRAREKTLPAMRDRLVETLGYGSPPAATSTTASQRPQAVRPSASAAPRSPTSAAAPPATPAAPSGQSSLLSVEQPAMTNAEPPATLPGNRLREPRRG